MTIHLGRRHEFTLASCVGSRFLMQMHRRIAPLLAGYVAVAREQTGHYAVEASAHAACGSPRGGIVARRLCVSRRQQCLPQVNSWSVAAVAPSASRLPADCGRSRPALRGHRTGAALPCDVGDHVTDLSAVTSVPARAVGGAERGSGAGERTRIAKRLVQAAVHVVLLVPLVRSVVDRLLSDTRLDGSGPLVLVTAVQRGQAGWCVLGCGLGASCNEPMLWCLWRCRSSALVAGFVPLQCTHSLPPSKPYLCPMFAAPMVVSRDGCLQLVSTPLPNETSNSPLHVPARTLCFEYGHCRAGDTYSR